MIFLDMFFDMNLPAALVLLAFWGGCIFLYIYHHQLWRDP